MSARRENESPSGGHHRNGSNDSFPLNGLPLPPAPPMPPASMVSHIPPVVLAPSAPPPPRYAPADHAASPEITQPPNPLQQLLFDTQQRYLQTYGIPGQQPPPRPMAPPVHLMTPFPPRNGSLPPPPMPQTMQLPLPPSSLFPSLHGAVPPPPSPALSPPSSAVATAASLPPSVPSGPPPGVPITSDEFEYTGAGQSSEQLEVTAVTIYKSQRVSQWGNMIAVNGQFISYPIKDGLIRVLGQNSVDRLLLREHQGHSVADTAFFSGRTDLFLSAGTEGKIVVYQLLSDPTRFEPQHVIYTPLQRVIWHPFDANRIAIVNGDSVYVVYLTELPDNGNANETDIASAGIRCHQTASQINDVVFSPCGRFLVTGGADGFVHIYDLDTADIGESAELLHRFEPFDGSEVWSVLFYGGENDSTLGLLVGGAKNAKLSLWEDPLSEGGQPTWIQTVKISHASSETSVYDVVFDAGADFLFVTDRTRPVLFVLHLSSNDQDSARRFDNITEFDVTNPVLSGAIMMRPASRDASEFTHQFFTVQTTAIQRYNVSSTRCFVPRAHETDDDEDGVEDDEQSQSVGARTTEGHNDTVSFQAPAESPRATASSPETEVDIQTPQQNGDDESEYTSTQASAHISPLGSPRRTFFSNLPHLSTHEDASSLAGEDAAGSVRSYARSSPTSSVRALRDDTSQLGEMSIDESVISSDQVLAYLRRMEAAQIQRDEQARDAMQKMMLTFGNQIAAQASAQVDQTIQNQIQTKLVPAMGRIVLHTMEHNFMKPVLAGFERVVVERLVPQMEAKINESLQSTLPDQVRDGVSDMVDRVVDEVRQPVRESFKECFRDIIIPSFQAATQKMFEQIHEHVLKGAATSAAATRQNGSMDAEVLAQLRQLVGVVNGLSRKVDELQANTVIGNGHLPPSQETDPEQQRIAAQKEQLLAFIRAQDYEEAFKFALGAQNVSLVTFVCEQCDAREVLSARPPHLSQMIILCLVQQLGVDLADKLPVKIQWLRDALLVLNPRDPSNVGFVGSVLQELQSSLDQVPETDRDSQYTLVHHILKSLLSSV